MNAKIRQAIRDHGRLPVDIDTLADDADLFQAGMTSHASVNVMLALEDGFDIEFPDRMLKRSVFESVVGDRRGADRARARVAGMSVTAMPTAPVPGRRARGSPRDDRRGPRRRRRPRCPLPVEAVDALRERRRAVGVRADRARRRRGLVRGDRAVPASSSARLLRDRDGVRDASDPGRRRSSVISRPARGSRPTCAELCERAAPDRLGDLRGRHRRRHGPLDRCRSPRRTAGCSASRSRPRRSATALTPTTC